MSSSQVSAKTLSKIRSYLGLQIIFLLIVILFGAYVRVSGSGAGCGNHWPLCQGKLIPHSLLTKTLIELTHRLSSGLLFVFSAFILYQVQKNLRAHRLLLRMARLSFFFLILEALLGAGLVLLEHVADNSSNYRAFSMSLHLINTFLLTGTSLLAWLLSREKFLKAQFVWQKNWSPKLLFGIFLFFFLSISGAITALGDTLFPISTHKEALLQSLDFKQHLFVNLRIYHPILAVFVSAYLLLLLRQIKNKMTSAEKNAQMVSMLILLQVLLGWLNLELLAPAWMQIVHLFFAETLWLSLLALAFKVHIKQAKNLTLQISS